MFRKDFILHKTTTLLSEYLNPIIVKTDKPRQKFLHQATAAILLSGRLIVKAALTAAVSKSIGAGRTRVKQTLVCLRIALVYMGLIGLCFLFFGQYLMRMWSSDDKVIQTGAGILVLAVVYQLFYASRTVYSGALRGAGDTLWLAITSGFGAAGVPGLGSFGSWTAATLSIIIIGFANRVRFKNNRWKHINLFERKAIVAEIGVQ
ncbi:MAG: hypothetical protein JW749_12370 [Sedimentisphaerales bacterium]|nr:hypothetical protein [Sedimentisphaerales bacterium]